jgi:DNA-directed RNA polymerase alpha subunit
MSMPARTIEELNLSTRPHNVLTRMFGDLAQTEITAIAKFSRTELLGQKNLGVTSLREIEQKLNENGIHLAELPAGMSGAD